jgi:putative FmdB family regulatory protein
VPTYEYRCPDGHLFEVFKSIHAPAPDACPTCGKGPLEVVLHPVAVHFKGSGFYSTDYGRGSKRKPESESSSSGSSDTGSGAAEKKKEDKPKVEKKAAEG